MEDSLDLSGRPFTRWPHSPVASHEVRRLYLDYANLDQAPKEIALLGGLEELSLDGNRLEVAPEAIQRLSHLRRPRVWSACAPCGTSALGRTSYATFHRPSSGWRGCAG